MSASTGVGGALDPPIAAAVAQNASRRTLFRGATVLAVVVVLIATLIPAAPVTALGRFDLPGAIGPGVALVCLLLGVSKGADWDWGSPTIAPSSC